MLTRRVIRPDEQVGDNTRQPQNDGDAGPAERCCGSARGLDGARQLLQGHRAGLHKGPVAVSAPDEAGAILDTASLAEHAVLRSWFTHPVPFQGRLATL